MVARLKAKRYKPQPAKRVYIPKDEHAKRPLGLPALEDKIVQKGIAWILEAIYEADFLDCSYGFRPGRNCHQAINAVDKTIMTNPINHVIEADIKGFFDNVSHEWMMKFLRGAHQRPELSAADTAIPEGGICGAGMLVATEQGRRKAEISARCFPIYSCTMCWTCGLRRESSDRSEGHAIWCAMRMILSAWSSTRTMPGRSSEPCGNGSRSSIWSYIRKRRA